MYSYPSAQENCTQAAGYNTEFRSKSRGAGGRIYQSVGSCKRQSLDTFKLEGEMINGEYEVLCLVREGQMNGEPLK